MIKTQVQIVNKLGLHARAAAKFVNVASQFGCTIRVHFGDKAVDGKSIMSVMMLAAGKGSQLELSADGSDAQVAIDALSALIANRFDEAE